MVGDDFVLSLNVAAAFDSGTVVALLASSTGALCDFDSLVDMYNAHWNRCGVESRQVRGRLYMYYCCAGYAARLRLGAEC